MVSEQAIISYHDDVEKFEWRHYVNKIIDDVDLIMASRGHETDLQTAHGMSSRINSLDAANQTIEKLDHPDYRTG